ncbi:MAG: hypothetical protein ACRDRT_01020, partial [Pseudonocardiaceae bacterium]
VKIVSGWRVRAAVQSPSHFRAFVPETRWVLLAALLVQRQREITDTLVELLIWRCCVGGGRGQAG